MSYELNFISIPRIDHHLSLNPDRLGVARAERRQSGLGDGLVLVGTTVGRWLNYLGGKQMKKVVVFSGR